MSVDVANSGSVDGAEVVQVYLGMPSGAPASPPRQLRGFSKGFLLAGQSGTADITLRRKDMSYWDVVSQNWIVPSGTFSISVGSSSRDIRLTGSIDVQ